MKIWAQQDDIYCAELGEFEGGPFIDGSELRVQDEKDNPKQNPGITAPMFSGGALRGIFALAFFRWSDVHFLLLREQEGQEDEIIGMTSISFEFRNSKKTPREHPEFAGSYILTVERGQGLSRLLYQARLEFLKEQATAIQAQMTIPAKNLASAGAARRAGFQGSADAYPPHQIFFTTQISRPSLGIDMLVPGA